jgi:L1 cell adhesion molecule like protein
VDTVRYNKEECQEIKRCVLRFSAILSQLQQTGMMNNSPAMSGALEDLEESLEHAIELVRRARRRAPSSASSPLGICRSSCTGSRKTS